MAKSEGIYGQSCMCCYYYLFPKNPKKYSRDPEGNAMGRCHRYPKPSELLSMDHWCGEWRAANERPLSCLTPEARERRMAAANTDRAGY